MISGIVINRLFLLWLSKSLETPQNFLRIIILRIFWGSSSSEFSEDRHPQNFLRILRWGPDEDPQKILRVRIFLKILRIFWGSSSSENSEDLQKILRMTILRKFWGWRSSENSEDDDPQKVLRILRKFWGWGPDEDPQKILRVRKVYRIRILKKICRFLGKIWRPLWKVWGVLSKFWGVSRILWFKVLTYNENMLVKDQLLLQHIIYKVRGYYVLKKHCQHFLRKLRQFSVDITSVSS